MGVEGLALKYAVGDDDDWRVIIVASGDTCIEPGTDDSSTGQWPSVCCGTESTPPFVSCAKGHARLTIRILLIARSTSDASYDRDSEVDEAAAAALVGLWLCLCCVWNSDLKAGDDGTAELT
jgi:hypothetical protein